MNNPLEEYGDRWRAAVAEPRDRPRWPAIAVAVAVLVGGGGAAVGLRGGAPTPKPAQLSPGVAPSPTEPLPRHAGTVADPVPYVDRQPGPADVPISPTLRDLALLSYRCRQPVTGSLTFAPSGEEVMGTLRLTSMGTCTLGSTLTVILETAAGGRVTATSVQPVTDARVADAVYPDVAFGGSVTALARITANRCQDPPVRAIVNGTIAIPVNGFPRGGCPTHSPAASDVTVTPLGAGYIPAVVPPGRDNLTVTLALPASAPVGGGSIAGLMTLSNLTAQAIPLKPCAAVGGSVVGKVNGVGSDFYSDLSFGLNCAQAPAAVPAHGSVVFAVNLPTRSGERGPVTVTLVIAGLRPAQPATVTLLDNTDRSAGTTTDPVPWQDIPAGPDDIPGPDFSSGGGASAACAALQGKLKMHVDGQRMLGSLQLFTAENSCAVYPFLSMVLQAADGSKLGETDAHGYDRLSRSAGYRPVNLGGATTGNGYADLTSMLMCATGPVTATVSAENGVTAKVPVTGIPATGCPASGVQHLSATPLGSGRAPAVPGAGFEQLKVGMSVLSMTTGRTVDARLTLRNPTDAAIPLKPCSAVSGFSSYVVAAGTDEDGLGFALNCAQAPTSVAAHGAVVFDVHLPVPAALRARRVTFTVSVGGIPGRATAGTQLR